MIQINDHPEIRCVERTGYPSWFTIPHDGYEQPEDFWEEGDDGDVYYGNETEDF